MNFAADTVTTINPNALGVFQLNTDSGRFRPRQWDQRPEDIKMQQIENDRLLLAFLDRLPLAQVEYTNPIMSFTVDTRPEYYTTLDNAFDAADVLLAPTAAYMDLVVSHIVRPGYVIHFPRYGVEMLVLDVDDDYSDGWTNDAGGACNIKVQWKTGPNVAMPIGADARPGGPVLGERGEAKRGVSTTPGDPQMNFISFYAGFFDMSLQQINSEMLAGWATLPKEMENLDWQFDNAIQTDLLFAHRNTYNDTDEDQVYRGAGIVDQLGDRVLDVGSDGNALTYGNLVSFWDPMFESRLSASMKDHFCGSRQYMDILRTARQEGRILQEPAPNADLGSNMYKVTTEGGRTVNVHEEKWVFRGELDDWGITLDNSNLGFGEYRGFSKQWIFDIQARSAITTRAHALMRSVAVNVFDDSTMGVIRGGTRVLINR